MWGIEQTALGRIIVPPLLPDGFALFYTTADFDGRLNTDATATLMRIVRERFGIEAVLATCTQVHGRNVVRAHAENTWRECDSCDGLWSSEPSTALGIKVADCLPVTIADMAKGVIANVHSGWRGAVQKIAAEAIDAIGGATPTTQAWLGPSIRVCCFEVGEEVVDQFRESYAEGELFVDRGGVKPHIDLPRLTAALLIARGIAPQNIHDSGLCTRCDTSIFHSYRRDGGRGGRNLAIAAH
ncbi:MAG: peptidoglycan editing factor PgeF [Acidobacteria bacterium]|nr:peptidoglycan editing factor PgeF [Acidobacteriota bacterium]MBV9069364.1 peptidoglycan editing factor PgeF [Acidobacteriota bacterium]MBV9187144.1 peptidoglycan editing factor PgeF [Acidobacteriota bacterium]